MQRAAALAVGAATAEAALGFIAPPAPLSAHQPRSNLRAPATATQGDGANHEPPNSGGTHGSSMVAAAGATIALAGLRGAKRAVQGRRRRGKASAVRPTACFAVAAAEVADTTDLDAVAKLERYVSEKGGSRVLRRILIANNGMAATKSIMSMKQWAYLEFGSDSLFEFVAMATRDDLDANAEFIRLADTFVEVPAGKNVNNYANVDLICEIAASQKVDCVWPGWGHASENPDLPVKLKALGITFLGPTQPVMSVLGDKIAANILAQTAGVPSIPWSGDGLQANLTAEGTIPDDIFKKGCVTSAQEAMDVAKRIGYPIMVKASEGGGGKGIRMCNTDEEVEASFPQVQSEAPPGSPIFVMQLCQGARHIEVQIVGDEHGNAVALNGRDCSTQRRFQKIFEEGPPAIVPKATFLEMERAAQRLVQNIGYIGAGTVEYLYDANSGDYYFLELNPRLQVEHPVTEELTQVNLPATQLQVGMGIPLEMMPQIRKFYGKAETDVTSPIKFLEDNYVYPTRHVIAARITAENPDDGFKPTSGKIERVKFQSSVACWGYFSVGANGGIHEYADSQFGHVFAHGVDREEARKALMLSLRNMEVVGDIRNPVEYLVELLGMDAFSKNTIDTAWLDGLIAAKTVALSYDNHDVVFYAAVVRALQHIEDKEAELLKAFEKGQLGPLQTMDAVNSFPIEIAFDGMKYNFDVMRAAADQLVFAIGNKTIVAKVRKRPDGSLFVSVGNSIKTVLGTEEALGLRLRIEGIATIMLPTLYDASELRSEFNGKVVRYLQDDGAIVQEGAPYVELEAMKMIMPVKAGATGKITHTRGAGSIVGAGEMLGTLELADRSQVKSIVPFSGSFELSATADGNLAPDDLMTQVELALDGFVPQQEPAAMAQQLFLTAPSYVHSEYAGKVLEKYLAVEEIFCEQAKANMSRDQGYLKLIAENKDSLGNVMATAMAHRQLENRNEIVLSTLHTIREVVDGGELLPLVQRLIELDADRGHGEVALLARQYVERMSTMPWGERVQSLRQALSAQTPATLDTSGLGAQAGGLEVALELAGDEAPVVRMNAAKLMIDRIYHGYTELSSEIREENGCTQSTWSFRYPAMPDVGEAMAQEGFLKVVPRFQEALKIFSEPIPLQDHLGQHANTVIVAVPNAFMREKNSFNSSDSDFQAMLKDTEAALKQGDASLRSAGIRKVCLILGQAPHMSRYATFMAENGWKEAMCCRDQPPTFRHLLEVGNLLQDYDLERIVPVMGRSSQVFLGTRKAEEDSRRKKKQQTVFSQLFTNDLVMDPEGDAWMEHSQALLLTSVDNLERARLNPDIGKEPSSQIFVHFNSLLPHDPQIVAEKMERFMNRCVAQQGGRLQKSKVDKITLKVGIGSPDTGRTHTLRVTASSMTGEYLKTSSVFEKSDPRSGLPASWVDVWTGQPCALKDPLENLVSRKRQMARAAGSTYAPEFLGMMKVELIKKWTAYRASGGSRTVPTELFKSCELVPGPDGELQESSRMPGENTCGVIAWRCTLATPEYPEGRDLVLIANDATFQAGSFGVAEDQLFQKASEYARMRGLPRIHIACNSGARVGLADELKEFVKAKWTDASDPSKGFDYLYLEEEDINRFPAGTVEAREEELDGRTVYAMDAIIGEGLKSTEGGIGVENLQGSALIAGETSRAYNEIFTLSYVTGRSVGIGAYLNRLGQRVIQMVNGPMILTGYGALNKLLGKQVYTSQDQLGGPQVMVPNGVTHKLVQSDQDGVGAILDWLAFTPKTASCSPPILDPTDPPERDVTFMPTKAPYDPRHMLAGTSTPEGEKLSGFFDEGTFQEYLEGWGKSVVVGRGKLGGIPMGIIAVETRNMERIVPADPANPISQEVVESQAGQVWFPDSAFKTATAIRDFNRGENLPLIIFANWRGFSGGTRDMYSEVLKFGAQIVDALVEYKHPVFVYIPPAGELRGGSWVVVDPAINPQVMEMYADVESRGGILEPAGIVEVKYRGAQQKELMHRLDPELQLLDAQLENHASTEVEDHQEVEAKIKAREEKLSPLYTQIACEFADLHDRSGRMEAKGVIRKSLEWRRAREFFYWRVRRRLLEEDALKRIQAADPELSVTEAKLLLQSTISAEEDQAAVAELENAPLDKEVEAVRIAGLKRRLKDLYEQLPESEQEATMAETR